MAVGGIERSDEYDHNQTDPERLSTGFERARGMEDLDVETLDADQTFRCFQNLSGRNLTPKSLKDYRRRFTQGLEMFLDYLRDPPNWKPMPERPRRLEIANEKRTKSESPRPKFQAKPTHGSVPQNGENLVDYPFPIRAGVIAA